MMKLTIGLTQLNKANIIQLLTIILNLKIEITSKK